METNLLVCCHAACVYTNTARRLWILSNRLQLFAVVVADIQISDIVVTYFTYPTPTITVSLDYKYNIQLYSNTCIWKYNVEPTKKARCRIPVASETAAANPKIWSWTERSCRWDDDGDIPSAQFTIY